MARGGGIGTEEVLMIGVVAGAGYLLWTGQMPDIVDAIKGALDQIGGQITSRLPSGGGGPSGPISGGSGCPSGASCGPDHQGSSKRWECNSVGSNAYEATWCGTMTSDELSIKLYGPPHHDNACCWCILYVKPNGEFRVGGEGPHRPGDFGCDHVRGNSMGRIQNTCIKAVIRPGPVVEGYGLVGGQWKLMVSYRGPCGCSKKSSTKTGNQVMFRCDGNISTSCATVRPLQDIRASRLAQQQQQEEIFIERPRIAIA